MACARQRKQDETELMRHPITELQLLVPPEGLFPVVVIWVTLLPLRPASVAEKLDVETAGISPSVPEAQVHHLLFQLRHGRNDALGHEEHVVGAPPLEPRKNGQDLLFIAGAANDELELM